MDDIFPRRSRSIGQSKAQTVSTVRFQPR
jgi:hypothetical protein